MKVTQQISSILRWLRQQQQVVRNRKAVRLSTLSGGIFFQRALRQLFCCEDKWLAQTAAEYRACPAAWENLSGLRSPSRRTDGFAKTLDVAEGFALWSLIKQVRPQVVVELGTQYGISARLWKEALKMYVPDHSLILCDLLDQRKFIRDHECTFVQGDACQTLPEVFASHSVDLLHNDAHLYSLIRWSVQEAKRYGVKTFTFHDVGRRKRGPFELKSATLSSREKLSHEEDYGICGTWERHVMAEVFDERILHEDAVIEDLCVIQVFDSLFGFGVVMLNSA